MEDKRRKRAKASANNTAANHRRKTSTPISGNAAQKKKRQAPPATRNGKTKRRSDASRKEQEQFRSSDAGVLDEHSHEQQGKSRNNKNRRSASDTAVSRKKQKKNVSSPGSGRGKKKPENKTGKAKQARKRGYPAPGVDSGMELPQIRNCPGTDKPRSSGRRVRRANVVLVNDEKGIKRRLAPSNMFAWGIYAVAIIALVICTFRLYDYLSETGGAEEQFDEVTIQYVSQEPESVENMDPDTSAWPPIVDFDSLIADNPDVVGWIRIPGTTVDYPVMANSEPDYYLHRDMYGNYSYPGSIFVDHQNTRDLDEDNHIMLYGHHMITPTMFHDVANYKYTDFFYAHRVIYFETPNITYVLKPVAEYTVDPKEYDTRKVVFNNSQEFQEYADKRLARSNYIRENDYKRSTVDKLFTLITCTDNGEARQVLECIVEQEYPTSMIPQVIAAAIDDEKAKEEKKSKKSKKSKKND